MLPVQSITNAKSSFCFAFSTSHSECELEDVSDSDQESSSQLDDELQDEEELSDDDNRDNSTPRPERRAEISLMKAPPPLAFSRPLTNIALGLLVLQFANKLNG